MISFRFFSSLFLLDKLSICPIFILNKYLCINKRNTSMAEQLETGMVIARNKTTFVINTCKCNYWHSCLRIKKI